MTFLRLRAVMLALISSMILLCNLQAAAQVQVQVVNTAKTPVPTRAQGTTTISGSVNITNASLPVNGSVSITNSTLPVSGSVNVTNSSLPVTGTVSVGNLPLDANGNVRTSVAPSATQYKYASILAIPCNPQSLGFQWDYCLQDGITLVEQQLTTLSSQGYDLFSVTVAPGAGSQFAIFMVYTLRAPVTSTQRKTETTR